MKLSFSTLGCPDWSLDEIVARGKEYGYDGIELRGIGPNLDVTRSPEFASPAACQQSVTLAADHGLQFCAIDTSTALTRSEPVERLEHLAMARAAIDLAYEIGAGWVRVFGGEPRKGTSRAGAIQLCVDGLLALGEYAAQSGSVRVVLETHDYFSRGFDVASVFRHLDQPNTGVLWDLHHPYRHGETPEETYELLKNNIAFTHVKDSSPDASYCLLGEGDVPIKQMLGLLVAGGYDGWLSLEWEKRWIPDLLDPTIALPQYARKLREYLAAL